MLTVQAADPDHTVTAQVKIIVIVSSAKSSRFLLPRRKTEYHSTFQMLNRFSVYLCHSVKAVIVMYNCNLCVDFWYCSCVLTARCVRNAASDGCFRMPMITGLTSHRMVSTSNTSLKKQNQVSFLAYTVRQIATKSNLFPWLGSASIHHF